MRIKLLDTNSTQFKHDNDLAGAYNICATLFQSARLEFGGRTLGQCTHDLGIVSSLDYRTNNTGSWLRNTGGRSAYQEADYSKRQSFMIQGGNQYLGAPLPDDVKLGAQPSSVDIQDLKITEAVRGQPEFEVLWRPPINLFMSYSGAIPAGDYSLVLQPKNSSSYQLAMVENPVSSGFATQATVANCQITGCDFFTFQLDGPRMDSGSYVLDLNQIQAQGVKLTSSELHALQYTVSPSTTQLYIGYQDDRVNSDGFQPDTVLRAHANSRLGLESAGEELKISHLQINYAGKSIPEVALDSKFSSDTKTGQDFTQCLYHQTALTTGLYYTDYESYDEWKKRGMYVAFDVAKDAKDRSTALTLNNGFNSANFANMRAYVATKSRQLARVQVDNGRIISVQVDDG
jgi:hypothetical protein